MIGCQLGEFLFEGLQVAADKLRLLRVSRYSEVCAAGDSGKPLQRCRITRCRLRYPCLRVVSQADGCHHGDNQVSPIKLAFKIIPCSRRCIIYLFASIQLFGDAQVCPFGGRYLYPISPRNDNSFKLSSDIQCAELKVYEIEPLLAAAKSSFRSGAANCDIHDARIYKCTDHRDKHRPPSSVRARNACLTRGDVAEDLTQLPHRSPPLAT